MFFYYAMGHAHDASSDGLFVGDCLITHCYQQVVPDCFLRGVCGRDERSLERPEPWGLSLLTLHVFARLRTCEVRNRWAPTSGPAAYKRHERYMSARTMRAARWYDCAIVTGLTSDGFLLRDCVRDCYGIDILDMMGFDIRRSFKESGFMFNATGTALNRHETQRVEGRRECGDDSFLCINTLVRRYYTFAPSCPIWWHSSTTHCWHSSTTKAPACLLLVRFFGTCHRSMPPTSATGCVFLAPAIATRQWLPTSTTTSLAFGMGIMSMVGYAEQQRQLKAFCKCTT